MRPTRDWRTQRTGERRREDNMESKELLGSQRSIHPKTVETESPKPKSENYRPVTGGYGDPSGLDAVPLGNQQETSRLRNRNNINYQRLSITEKPKNSPGLVNWNRYPPSEPQKSYIRPITKHHITNQTTNHKNAVLNINGKSKASQDSDQVKPDIDRELRNAFEGEKSAAVIHRFEELPPGSTLIFYRYCDHENAAYKNVFLAFTVMLDAEVEVSSTVSLGRVEEMV
ncbi:hypothetical protein G5714_009321 [Onychostoma macrolepis]|uniref:Torsin-1A-interacting protein 1/2 AAA+ activator domain-containing protein n=1 Tax=Onychostoma macrolepis TaxID=369639 RepID=A0A7J6CRW7_9TELE|nr:hypothetical protein G5714_009321 [Onychostoma macrolepis]